MNLPILNFVTFPVLTDKNVSFHTALTTCRFQVRASFKTHTDTNCILSIVPPNYTASSSFECFEEQDIQQKKMLKA